eukprot:5990896-Pyramimonas_sp.AAC.1
MLGRPSASRLARIPLSPRPEDTIFLSDGWSAPAVRLPPAAPQVSRCFRGPTTSLRWDRARTPRA